MQKRPGTHFNAYDDLFSIQKRDEEDLQALIKHIDDALHCICNLRSNTFTLDKLDNELGAIALICILRDDYNSFVSSLLLKDDLDKAVVQIAFVCKDNQCRHRQEESPAVGSALAASSTSSTCCDFCGLTGHAQPECRKYACAKEQIVKNRNNSKKDKANTAKTPETPTEFAGNASAPSTSPSPIPPNFDWLADTGATSHMTPHRHWVRNYSPFCILIKLADNSIVYLSGEGTVVFNPVMMDGKALQPVEFTRVLHVPLLQNNLLSCLYLAQHKQIIIHIDSEQIDFSLHGKSLFCAPIWLDNCAILSASSAPLSESVNWVSILSLTPSLWHHHYCYHNL